eukprot:scaffold3.g6330.t1
MARAAEGWPGARPQAWAWLAGIWAAGATAAAAVYGDLLLAQLGFLRAGRVLALATKESAIALAGAVGATLFLKTAFIWGSSRFGRPLSRFSLAVFPPLNAVCEGALLLLVFDAARWALGTYLQLDLPEHWAPGRPALALHRGDINQPLLFREFILGFGPYLLALAVGYSWVWEEKVLPVHLDLEAPNKFFKALVLQQFLMVAIYFLAGDLVTYFAVRWLSDLLTVVAVRLPPPGAAHAPLPYSEGDGGEGEPPRPAQPEAGGSGGRGRRGGKKDR